MVEAQLLLFDLAPPPRRLQDASVRSRRGRRIDLNPPHPARFCALARKNRP